MSTSRFLVRKDQLSRTEWEIEPDAPLQAGEIRVHIDRFALTSNNITYAAFGDAMNYWSFFPSRARAGASYRFGVSVMWCSPCTPAWPWVSGFTVTSRWPAAWC